MRLNLTLVSENGFLDHHFVIILIFENLYAAF